MLLEHLKIPYNNLEKVKPKNFSREEEANNAINYINSYFSNLNLWFNFVEYYELFNYLDIDKQNIYNTIQNKLINHCKEHKPLNITSLNYNKLLDNNNKWSYDNIIIDNSKPFIYIITIKEKYLTNYNYKKILKNLDIIFFYANVNKEDKYNFKKYIYKFYYDGLINKFSDFLLIDSCITIIVSITIQAKLIKQLNIFLDRHNNAIWE